MKPNILRNAWVQLKKFGLDYDDFPTMVDNLGLLLWLLTINIQKKWTQSVHIIFYILSTIGVITYLYVHGFSMIWLVCFRYGKKEIEATCVVLALSACSITSVTKLAFMKLYAKEIKITIQRYLKCDSQVIPDTRFAKNLRKNLRAVKKRSLIIWISLVTNAFAYLARPLITPGRHFSVELMLLYGLEPMFESPNYEICTFILTTGIGFGVYALVGIAVYVLITVGYNEAQMYALSDELKHVWDDSRNFYNHIKHRISDKRRAVYIKQETMNEFIRIRLRDIAKFHVANINLLRHLDAELRPTLALEYSILACAITTELLGGLEHTYLTVPYTVVQITIDCLAGQRLIDACDELERSLYSCQWENFNVSNQRTVLLMLMMSQKTLMLSAGGVTKLNFNCLMVILKTSYSTYTTLKSTMKKNA
ncbi:uncharacterized protein LOC123660567 [Melitaea cinxia]|uniref:uncharacterized protein LOC123660567 n=1 Tax=Melitaea cinxia TaxID=113334 RepID=UPI001E273793|nr:uncharacterized protein LOC123660567 [Melitaea cinxia]